MLLPRWNLLLLPKTLPKNQIRIFHSCSSLKLFLTSWTLPWEPSFSPFLCVRRMFQFLHVFPDSCLDTTGALLLTAILLISLSYPRVRVLNSWLLCDWVCHCFHQLVIMECSSYLIGESFKCKGMWGRGKGYLLYVEKYFSTTHIFILWIFWMLPSILNWNTVF